MSFDRNSCKIIIMNIPDRDGRGYLFCLIDNVCLLTFARYVAAQKICFAEIENNT